MKAKTIQNMKSIFLFLSTVFTILLLIPARAVAANKRWEMRRYSYFIFVKFILVSLAAGLWLAPSTARAEGLPEAEWEDVDEITPGWMSVAIPLSEGRALLTGFPEPCSFDPNINCPSKKAYLYEPSTGLTQIDDVPGYLDSHFGAPLDNGRRALVGGGLLYDEVIGKFRPVDKCFIFDLESEEWSVAARLPKGTFNFYTNIAATLKDGRVIITGGSTLEDVLLPDEVFSPYLASRNVFIFNPEGETFYPEDGTTLPGQWEEKAKMPPTRTLTTYIPDNPDVPLPPEKQGIEVGRVTHNTVVLRDGRVLIIGGRWSQPAYYHGMEEVDMYDFSTNTWTSLSKLPSADSDGDIGYGGRAFPSVSLLASSEASSEETGEVLVFGGWVIKFVERYLGGVRYIFIQGPRVPRRSAFVLNPMTNQWRRVGDLNVRRSGSLTAPWPSYETATFAIAIGGRSITSLIPAAEVYDASTETWFLLPPEPELAPDDNQIRQGTSLTDGTVLTWSSVELGPQGKTSVKRLHPAGLDE